MVPITNYQILKSNSITFEFLKITKQSIMVKVIWKVLVIAIFLLGVFPVKGQSCLDSSKTYFFNYNGKNYAVVKEQKSWTAAVACARELGYVLVHINDSAEQNAIADTIINGANVSPSYTTVADGGGAAYVWIGATDKGTEGQWQWDGDDTLSAVDFWTGQGNAGSNNGSPVQGAYNNWGNAINGAPAEPDDFNGQDGGSMALQNWPFGKAFQWNDIDLSNQLYYVIEATSGIGIEEQEQVKNVPFKLFPNPAGEYVQLQNEASLAIQSLQITGINGALIWENSRPDDLNPRLDISFLRPGVYTLTLITDAGQRHALRLVVE